MSQWYSVAEIFNAPFDEKWSQSKKFMLTNLRALGGMKSATDGSTVEEMSVLMNKLRDTNQEPTDITEVSLLTTSNIISGVLFNKRFDHDDPELHELKDLVAEFYAILNEFNIFEFMLPSWLSSLFQRKKLQRFRSTLKRCEDYVAKQVEEHRKSLDPANPRDFIDMYLLKPDMEVGKGLYDTIIVFMPDSIDTVSVFMRWVTLYLGLHPEVQKKAHAEIDELVGPNQMVCISVFKYSTNLRRFSYKFS